MIDRARKVARYNGHVSYIERGRHAYVYVTEEGMKRHKSLGREHSPGVVTSALASALETDGEKSHLMKRKRFGKKRNLQLRKAPLLP